MKRLKVFSLLLLALIGLLSQQLLANEIDVQLGTPLRLKAYGCPQGQKSVILFKRPGQNVKFEKEDSKNPWKGNMAGSQVLSHEYEVSVECRRVYCVLAKKPFSFTKYSIALEPTQKDGRAQIITSKYRNKNDAKAEISKLIEQEICSHQRVHRTGKGWVENFIPYESSNPFNID